MKILLIEDDRDIAELIDYNFKQEKCTVFYAASGTEGLKKARSERPDLIILDLMLPDMNGLEICKSLKFSEKTRLIPILMLTAKGEEIDRVVGFEVGADDYMTKPFSPRELVLRAKAILRRAEVSGTKESAERFRFGLLDLNPAKFELRVDKTLVRLTAIEFKLLAYLLKSKGRVATREVLLDQVWGYDSSLTTRTVDVHIKRLRGKLGKAEGYIETIRGVGYRMIEEPGSL